MALMTTGKCSIPSSSGAGGGINRGKTGPPIMKKREAKTIRVVNNGGGLPQGDPQAVEEVDLGRERSPK